MLSRELEVAKEAVKTAAEICRRVQSSIDAESIEKADRSPVTIADFASQAAICRAIRLAFPNDPIIAEEDSQQLRDGERTALSKVVEQLDRQRLGCDEDTACSWIDFGNASEFSSRFWTLDPIDGTKGFLRGDQYAISLALIENGRVTLGVVGCPNLNGGSLFYAVSDSGSWRELLTDGDLSRVSVSGEDDVRMLRFCESFESGHSSHSLSSQIADSLGVTAEPARLDSQAKYAFVATGAAEAYLRLPTRPGYVEKIWDHAGGAILVEEAGGRVTDIAGRSLDFSRGKLLSENQGIVATNGPLHDEILAAISRFR